MGKHHRPRWLMVMLMLILAGVDVASHARQDPCHRLHHCPSDHQTSICGDLGRCHQ